MKWEIILRWMAVVPAAIIGAIVGGLACNLVWGMGFASKGMIVEILQSFVCPVFFIQAGVSVAPAHKSRTAIVLAVLLCVFFALIMGAAIMASYAYNMSSSTFDGSMVGQGIRVVISVFMAVITAFHYNSVREVDWVGDRFTRDIISSPDPKPHPRPRRYIP